MNACLPALVLLLLANTSIAVASVVAAALAQQTDGSKLAVFRFCAQHRFQVRAFRYAGVNVLASASVGAAEQTAS